jgi:CDP-diacylglycerol--glycerol-3-phosphate 3-phosphatidyltransferase
VDFSAYLDRWSAVHGGYDPRRSVWSHSWLRAVYALAAPLARAGMRPHAVTLAGLLACAVAPVAARAGLVPLAAVAVAASGLLDSLDGAVAVLRDRVTSFGYVLDSVADRVGEALYLWALWLLGAPAWLCVTAGALAWLAEYVRARAVGAGLDDIVVVTVWERAMRIAVTVSGLLVAGLLGLAGQPDRAGALAATATVGLWVLLGLVGLVHLLVAVRRRLPGDHHPGVPRSGRLSGGDHAPGPINPAVISADNATSGSPPPG